MKIVQTSDHFNQILSTSEKLTSKMKSDLNLSIAENKDNLLSLISIKESSLVKHQAAILEEMKRSSLEERKGSFTNDIKLAEEWFTNFRMFLTTEVFIEHQNLPTIIDICEVLKLLLFYCCFIITSCLCCFEFVVQFL